MREAGGLTIRLTAAAAAAAMLAGVAPATDQEVRVGQTFEITRNSASAEHTSDGSSSSLTDRDTFVERVIAVRADGVEREYDLVGDATAEDRARIWEFPARIFTPFTGPSQLLNEPDLERRLDTWLKIGKIPRTACGRWIFTWNAFRIACDPRSVLKTVAAIDLGSRNLHEGYLYRDSMAHTSTPLVAARAGSDAALVAKLEVDPEVVRSDRADGDVIAAEIIGKTLTREQAIKARAADTISGAVTVRFDLDGEGRTLRRTRIITLRTKLGAGKIEERKTTETIERRLLPSLRS